MPIIRVAREHVSVALRGAGDAGAIRPIFGFWGVSREQSS